MNEQISNISINECTTSSVDVNTLHSLREMLGDNDAIFTKVVQCYLAESAQLVTEISDHVNNNNSKLIEITAHKLKSSSAAIGAVNLTQLCLEMEKLGKLGNVTGCLEKLSQLTQEYEKVAVVLQKNLQQFEENIQE
jgi:HPt (histidine-containing phosphotransfer) domain-containing protein